MLPIVARRCGCGEEWASLPHAAHVVEPDKRGLCYGTHHDGVTSASHQLPEIPVFDVGPDFPIETARLAGRERAYAMLDAATAGVPLFALKAADAISRRWLSARPSRYLRELDEIARLSTRPGAYFLNVHYEWGCTTAAKSAVHGAAARLLRTLDWNVNGLGRYVVATRIASAFRPWVSLTWPGFTGVLQAMAPGRLRRLSISQASGSARGSSRLIGS
jgi:hypothetical protein